MEGSVKSYANHGKSFPHGRVLEVYVHFALMYTTDHIFLVLPIKDIINKDGDPTTPHKLATGTKPSVSHLRVLFCLCVLRKATAQVETKTLNMHHHAKKGFAESLWVLHSIKKDILCTYPVLER